MKIPEMSTGVEECTIPARARDKIFPSPDRMVRQHPIRVAESCVRSCYSVGILLYIKLLKKFIMSPVTWKRTQWVQRALSSVNGPGSLIQFNLPLEDLFSHPPSRYGFFWPTQHSILKNKEIEREKSGGGFSLLEKRKIKGTVAWDVLSFKPF